MTPAGKPPQERYISESDYHNESDIPKIISFLENTSLKKGWDANISDGAGDGGIRIPAKYVRGFVEMLRSAGSSAAAPAPSATRRQLYDAGIKGYHDGVLAGLKGNNDVTAWVEREDIFSSLTEYAERLDNPAFKESLMNLIQALRDERDSE